MENVLLYLVTVTDVLLRMLKVRYVVCHFAYQPKLLGLLCYKKTPFSENCNVMRKGIITISRNNKTAYNVLQYKVGSVSALRNKSPQRSLLDAAACITKP
jgi:hypothetical protein